MNRKIREEMETFFLQREAAGLTVKAADLLTHARNNAESAVYRWLEAKGAFDPEKAVEQYGLMLCRKLIIKVRITYPARDNTPLRVRAYTSLPTDRTQGGGYRRTESVLAADALRKEALMAARAELIAIERKYKALEELDEIRAAIRKLAAG